MNYRKDYSCFKFGTCTVPDGERGDWKISTFEITEDGARFHNLRAMINRSRYQMVFPGTYRRLSHRNRGVIMSNTTMEIDTNREAYYASHGRVIINGLGLGMLLEGILAKTDSNGDPSVSFVRVIEIDADVIALVGPHFAHDPRVEIVHSDALTYKPPKGEPPFDYAWHDIWDTICGDNLPSMAALGRKWSKKRAHSQGWWVRDECRRIA
jgi:hypothetical protein